MASAFAFLLLAVLCAGVTFALEFLLHKRRGGTADVESPLKLPRHDVRVIDKSVLHCSRRSKSSL